MARRRRWTRRSCARSPGPSSRCRPRRECFVLNRYLGLSEREIATRLGISKSLVGKHVLRAALLIQQHQQGLHR